MYVPFLRKRNGDNHLNPVFASTLLLEANESASSTSITQWYFPTLRTSLWNARCLLLFFNFFHFYAKHSEHYFLGLKFNILTLASMNIRLNVCRVARLSRRVTNVIAARVRNVSSVLGTSKDFLPKPRLNEHVPEGDQQKSPVKTCSCSLHHLIPCWSKHCQNFLDSNDVEVG